VTVALSALPCGEVEAARCGPLWSTKAGTATAFRRVEKLSVY
jgi:hypothetical protein